MAIIKSLMDIDFYKFTMGQLVFHRHPNVPVRYGLTNRTTKVALAEFVSEDDLRRELDAVRKLRFTKSDLHYLRGTDEYNDRMFKEDYLDFLEGLTLPEYELSVKDGQFVWECHGPWSSHIYWETIPLSIINELYYRALRKRMSSFEQDVLYAQGALRLHGKIERLREFLNLKFTDFGTRRRFSRKWQQYCCRVAAAELPGQFLGTSNAWLAKKYDLLPMGTSAHELYMVYSGIYHADYLDIQSSHNRVLQDWWEEYGYALSVALTDTYGSEFFFHDFSREQAFKWKGVRHDSGDPFEFGERTISFYEKHGINPMAERQEKMIVFSDGLDVDTIINLYKRFAHRIKVSFGWGTNFTNDLGLANLSLVVKAISSNGHPTVKLSDNLAKAMGPKEEVEYFKHIFGYANTYSATCVV